MPFSTEDQARDWLKEFQKSSSSTWRIARTYPNAGSRNTYRVDLQCQHNTRPRSATADLRKGSKNTGCPATMSVTVKRPFDVRGRIRTNDPHIKDGYFTTVSLKWLHNHEMSSADALRRRDVSEEAVQKLLDFFKAGYSPTAALDTLKYDLQEQYSAEEYTRISADRSICPDLQFCFRLFYKEFKKHYGEPGGDDMMATLKENLLRYNSGQNENCVKAETVPDGQIVIAICTPLMKRVHEKWNYSGEMMFVDSSGNMDKQNCRVFLFLTHSPAGALPVGVVVTSSESESTLTAAFRLMKTLLPDGAFFGEGPHVIMTDDCSSLRNALHVVFPKSSLLLCVFHLLQAMWRWLWNQNNRIVKADRPYLLGVLKSMIYAESEEDLETIFQRSAENDPITQKYPNYVKHLETQYLRRDLWAVAARKDLSTRGNNTTAFCEAGMRVLKDNIFHRLRAFNICQLTDFILTRLEDYYIRRLMDVANNRLSGYSTTSRFYPDHKDVNLESIKKIADNEYMVQSSHGDVSYNVNTELGTCLCPVGRSGAPCKHQAAVINKFSLSSLNFLPVKSAKIRKIFYAIAIGSSAEEIADSWFQPLKSGVFSKEIENESNTVHEQTPVDDTPMDTAVPNSADMYDVSSQQNQPNTESDEDGTLSLEQEFGAVLDQISSKLQTSPEEYRKAIKAFICSYRKITTDSQLLSALHTFGKSIVSSKLSRGKSFHSSQKIGVQPTSISRRKMAMGGKRRLNSGRPSKASYVVEHGYSKKKNTSSFRCFSTNRQIAPHSLSHCVSSNVSLGRTHSKN
ncbi:hypothetical protein HOLleu_43823 [Holothuria leucospilota]|uniref:SWIM-type domain-containing protein n=1 Tax=Holothuria leucospilota TaxID=206669 RepID=A0A9Q1BAU3_HOLLE|nr:hypothetical protein HOLleu_43823 [Holothuria leucospilota]